MMIILHFFSEIKVFLFFFLFLFFNFLRTIFNDDLYIKTFYCRINTNYDSLITNDMWINERYTLFYIIDASLHNDVI